MKIEPQGRAPSGHRGTRPFALQQPLLGVPGRCGAEQVGGHHTAHTAECLKADAGQTVGLLFFVLKAISTFLPDLPNAVACANYRVANILRNFAKHFSCRNFLREIIIQKSYLQKYFAKFLNTKFFSTTLFSRKVRGCIHHNYDYIPLPLHQFIAWFVT
jgi:hypothetical protein